MDFQSSGPRSTYDRFAATSASVVFAVMLCVVLQGLIALGWISPFVIPEPTSIASSIPRLFLQEGLTDAFFLTSSAVGLVILSAAIIGIPCGWMLYRFPSYGRAYEAWLGAAFAAPLILLYPVFMVVFGRGILTIVVMGSLTVVIPIILYTLQGLRDIPRVYLNVARMLNLSGAQTVFKVLLPASLPTVFTGVRLGLIYALIYVVAFEFLASVGGLGSLISNLYDRYDVAGMYGVIIFVIVLSSIILSVSERLEQWLNAR